MNMTFRSPARMRGFNLIEVLITLLIAALGLAGLAALMLNGVATANSANLNSVAVGHAQTGVDMMRANLDAYMDGWYDGTNTSGAAPATVTCTGSNGCSGAQQATNDFASWRERVAASLPGGVAFMCMDSTPDDGQPAALACDGNGYNVIKIFWLEARGADALEGTDTFHRYATTVNP